MSRYSTFEWRRGLVLSATLFLMLTAFSSCKKKDHFIGENSIDPNSLLNSGGIDTFSLVTFTIEEDSVITDNPAFGILGSYNDPVFGTVNSEIYTQFRLSGLNPNFGDVNSIVLDSFVLGLEYIGYYGKSGIQNVEVFEITDSDGLSLDSTYYSFSTKTTNGIDLVEPGKGMLDFNTSNLTVIGNDTVDSQLRIYLDTNLAKSMIQEATNNPTTFSSNDEFLDYFICAG